MTACCGNSPTSMRPTLITTARELAVKDTVKPGRKPRVLLELRGLRHTKPWTFSRKYLEDFIWRSLFAKSLPASGFELVTRARQLVCRLPWNTMHIAGLSTVMFRRQAKYPKLRTSGIDIFIS